MLHSARDEKGKAQESIGSWAFPAFIRGLPLFVGITIPNVVIWYCGNCHSRKVVMRKCSNIHICKIVNA